MHFHAIIRSIFVAASLLGVSGLLIAAPVARADPSVNVGIADDRLSAEVTISGLSCADVQEYLTAPSLKSIAGQVRSQLSCGSATSSSSDSGSSVIATCKLLNTCIEDGTGDILPNAHPALKDLQTYTDQLQQ